MQANIADLKEQVLNIYYSTEIFSKTNSFQVDTCLGAQQMVDILTNKNLTLEDQVRELQEQVDNLVSFN